MSTFEVVIPILVAFHAQSLRPHLRVQKTLYLVNPFKIKFKVTLNIGPAEVRRLESAITRRLHVSICHVFYGCRTTFTESKPYGAKIQ